MESDEITLGMAVACVRGFIEKEQDEIWAFAVKEKGEMWVLRLGIDAHQLLPRPNGLGWAWHRCAPATAPVATNQISPTQQRWQQLVCVRAQLGPSWCASVPSSARAEQSPAWPELGTDAHQLLPTLLGGTDEVFFGEAVVMVAAGSHHAACVTAKGMLWSWGDGRNGRLGHGDCTPRQHPERLGKEMYGGSPAVMVACGGSHTLVLTAMGCVYSCGAGYYGQLGHDAFMSTAQQFSGADKLVLTLVGATKFRDAQIVMIAAGALHSVALGADGRVWTWGMGRSGQLGLGRLVPTPLGETKMTVPMLLVENALGGAAAVLVAAGGEHTLAVTIAGSLWVWGLGSHGQLGLGDLDNRLVPTLVGEEAFEGLQVLTVACSTAHTLTVTKDGALWTFGRGRDGRLGQRDEGDRLVPTRINAQHFGNAKIVSVAAGHSHSAAVTEEGALYIFGGGARKGCPNYRIPVHTPVSPRLLQGARAGRCGYAITPIAPHMPQGARVGRCGHCLPPLHALAFAMGTHARLGSGVQRGFHLSGMYIHVRI